MPLDVPALERDLASLPRRAVAAFAVRAARRVAPTVADAAEKYGPEAWEWLNATDAAIRAAETFAGGAAASRFTLDVAAELPRAAANALSAAARRLGPSPAVERAELAFAAAAFAADAARAATPARAAQLAKQAATSTDAGPYPVARLLAFDAATLAGMPLGSPDDLGPPVDPSPAGPLGELWPAGEPDGWSEAWAGLAERAANLPRWIALPNG